MVMTRSVVIFTPALMYQDGKFGMQYPGSVVSQNFLTGMQTKMAVKSCVVDHAMMMLPRIHIAFRMR